MLGLEVRHFGYRIRHGDGALFQIRCMQAFAVVHEKHTEQNADDEREAQQGNGKIENQALGDFVFHELTSSKL